MISKEEARELIDSIISLTGKTQEEIGVLLGYSKNYISDILSPSGKITKRFIDALNKLHSDYSEIPNTLKIGGLNLNEYLSRLEERIILLEATKEVMGEKIAELNYELKRTPISGVLTDLEKEIKKRYRIRFDELKAKQ